MKQKNGAKLNSAMKRWIMTILFLGLSFALLSGCSTDGKDGDQEGKLKVTATIGMIADVAQQIGGEHVEVTGIMGPGTDPHYYKASQGDIRRMDGADLIFYNGLFLEGAMGEMLEKLAASKPVIAVTSGIPEDMLMLAEEEDGTEELDPHVWFDVKLWMYAAELIRDTLIEYDAGNETYYREQAERYIAELEELDGYAKERMAEIPEESRVLITAHDAFGYFGRAYGIEVKGLQGISTASEYSARDVSELRDYIVENKIKAIFVESSISDRSIQAVIEGAKSLGHEVVIGGELFSDAMGEEGSEGDSYIGMIRHNVDTIVNALK